LLIKFGEHAPILREPDRVQSRSGIALHTEISVAQLVNNLLITAPILEIRPDFPRYRTRGN
jgi:hypothetical protein